MNKHARAALAALLRRAERAWARDAASTITLRLSEASFRAYLELDTRTAKDEFHATMRSAERGGAIRIEWDRLAGEDGQIQRVVLVNANALAAYLGVTPLWVAFKHARESLEERTDLPGIRRLLEAWRQGKRPRSVGPEHISSVLDALQVLTAQHASNYEDAPIRQVSARLFSDSKRIEELFPILDMLIQEDHQGAIAQSSEEVLARLGLVRYPQPTLIAGQARIRFRNGDALAIPQPYIGLSPNSLSAIELLAGVRYILTVENYTTFNEIAKGKAGDIEGVILYTAGMPSPAFLNVYALLLTAAPDKVTVYHWGDIDLGGFRIADILAREARRKSRSVRLWNMNPADHAGLPSWRNLSNEEIRWIKKIADQYGWIEERAGIEAVGAAYEQESLRVICPH